MTAPSAALLLLADGRFPAGGHAHSAGVESAVSDGRVHDLASLEAFLDGRLRTVALVDASLSAATVSLLIELDHTTALAALRALDVEADVRIPVAGLRAASRKLGRQLLRVAGRCWAHPVLDAAGSVELDGPHASVALGAVGVATGLGMVDVAALSVHHAVTTPAQAAVRLLGLDPFGTAGLTARLAATSAEIIEAAVAAAGRPLDQLPAVGAVRCDIAAEAHGRLPSRLFAT